MSNLHIEISRSGVCAALGSNYCTVEHFVNIQACKYAASDPLSAALFLSYCYLSMIIDTAVIQGSLVYM